MICPPLPQSLYYKDWFIISFIIHINNESSYDYKNNYCFACAVAVPLGSSAQQKLNVKEQIVLAEKQMRNAQTGADGINPRVMISAVIIKHMGDLSDRQTLQQMQEICKCNIL